MGYYLVLSRRERGVFSEWLGREVKEGEVVLGAVVLFQGRASLWDRITLVSQEELNNSFREGLERLGEYFNGDNGEGCLDRLFIAVVILAMIVRGLGRS